MKKWQTLKKELFKDKRVALEYGKLGPKYQLIAQLIRARLNRGLTQKQLAEKIGTKQSAIARVESGSANISLEFLEKMTQATGSKLEIVIK
jgi:ribosome-binding protein aMBF1 (putative translation factor)